MLPLFNRLIYVVPAAILIMTACGGKKEKSAASNKDLPPIQEVYDSYYNEIIKLYPVWANRSAAVDKYYGRYTNKLTREFREKKQAFFRNHLEQIRQYNRDSLAPQDRINYDVMVWECKKEMKPTHPIEFYLPLSHLGSPHLVMGQLVSGNSAQPFATPADYDTWMERVEGYLDFLDTAKVRMQEGMKKGYAQPKPIIKKMISQFENMGQGPVEENLYYRPVKQMPDSIPDQEQARIDSNYRQMIKERVIPHHQKMADFLEEKYLPEARQTAGIKGLEGSEEYYRRRIKNSTTTQLSPDSIFKLGKSQVARLEKEMNQVKEEVGFKGTLQEFFSYLQQKESLTPFDKPEQVVDHYREIHEKIKPHVDKLFDRQPETPFEVRQVDEFREETTSHQYRPGSPDGSQPGVFYVPIPDAKEYHVMKSQTVFLHEAIPGHHFQIMLQKENDHIHKFRNFIGFGAYVEGWALYTETLGKELGLYKDPYQHFGMLKFQMFRAVRLVVDVGLHNKGWSRERAMRYFSEHFGGDKGYAVNQIERYMVWPGQALSYMIGQLAIKDLKQKAQQKMGDRFDVKQFHNVILRTGNVPLSVLRERVNVWISRSTEAGV